MARKKAVTDGVELTEGAEVAPEEVEAVAVDAEPETDLIAVLMCSGVTVLGKKVCINGHEHVELENSDGSKYLVHKNEVHNYYEV